MDDAGPRSWTPYAHWARKLVGDLASDYFALLQLELQLHIAQATVTTQNDSVTLTTQCVEHGIANTVDLLQAQQVLDSANAQIPDLERLISQEEDATSILLGGYPHAVTRGRPLVEERANTSARGATRSAFVLIARRPDIHQAEQIVVRQMPRSESLPVLPTSRRRGSSLKWR